MGPKARNVPTANKPLSRNAAGSKSKPKAPPKQPLPVAERLKRLFTSLCAQIDGGHFTNAIKTCDKSASAFCYTGMLCLCVSVLRIDPNDQDALQTKLFLLLQTEQYDAALSLIDQSDAFVFEKAYSLYRTNSEQEARDALNVLKKSRGEDDRGILHLEAQLVWNHIL